MIGPLAWLAAASLWAAPPEWAVSGKSPSHPPSLWVVGAGSSTESVDLARQSAMADVVRQVRSRVKSRSEDERWESSSTERGSSRGEAAWSGAQVRADEEVAGIQIAETARDGKTWYALAVLDRAAFAAPGRAAMREAATDAVDRAKAASEAFWSLRPLETLDALRQIELDRRRFRDGQDRAALGEPDALTEAFPVPSARVDSLRHEVTRAFSFRMFRDSLEFAPDREWPDSIGLTARFGDVPVAGLEVDLADPSGQILTSARTDSAGRVQLRPARLSAATSTSWARWTLRPRLDARPAPELPLAVRLSGSSARLRLAWTGAVDPDSKALVTQRLAQAGWTLDSLGEIAVSARLEFKDKGEIQGFSGTVRRVEAKVTLTRGDARVEVQGIGTGATNAQASRNALERLALPPDALRTLLARP